MPIVGPGPALNDLVESHVDFVAAETIGQRGRVGSGRLSQGLRSLRACAAGDAAGCADREEAGVRYEMTSGPGCSPPRASRPR